jgi:pimeloyl-ACP methyl ester carboxylesterase
VSRVIELRHNKTCLALHELRAAPGRPLLLLHGLGEHTPARAPAYVDPWLGPVFGLDFTGHGASTKPNGGGYTAEILMADADAALEHLGEVTILGRGLGAYIGLLTAGARAELVRGVVLADGPGLVGGGIRPGSAYVLTVDDEAKGNPDPYALFELSRDVRPPDYAQEYVRQIMQWSGMDQPIAVATVTKPEWIEAVIDEPGVVEVSLEEALRLFARDAGHARSGGA